MTRLFDPRDDGPKSGAATTITPRNYASSLPGVTGIGFSEHPQLDAGLWRSFGHRRVGVETVIRLLVCEDIP